VEIPKAGGKGVRVLGVPTVSDRIAQTVVRSYLEPEVEPIFHPDSYGYRPGRSALDALATCRGRSWENDWVTDLDIRAFFDSLDHDLVLRAVSKHTGLRWVLLYVQRWLKAPLQREDGTLVQRDRGTPQGSAMVWSYTRTRRASCTARTPTAAALMSTSGSPSWATRFVNDS
jgi:RNA-directed DNA polymerase